MSDKSNIEWTDATWNPIRARRLTDIGGRVGWHCERVSPGCQHCYAERLNAQRFGTQLPYTRPSRDRVEVGIHEATLEKPLHWSRARKVFVCSMTDLFGEWVPDEMIDRVFAVMALTPQHTYQVLTKRPERMREYLNDMGIHYVGDVHGEYMERWGDAAVSLTGDPCSAGAPVEDCGWPLPNVWLGTSVEDQQRAEERIPELLACPAAVRFLSCEPLLAPLDLRLGSPDFGWPCGTCEGSGSVPVNDNGDRTRSWDLASGGAACPTCEDASGTLAPDWVIVGGESGPGARPMDLEWARSLVAQCKAAGVACFVKQLGSNPSVRLRASTITGWPLPKLQSRHGSDMKEWPADLQVREQPL